MAAERVHIQPNNCRLSKAPSIGKQELAIILDKPYQWRDTINTQHLVECTHKSPKEGETNSIRFYMDEDHRYRGCCENCIHRIPDSERLRGVGTFAQWPE